MSNLIQKTAALAAAMLVTGNLKGLLDSGKIHVYAGTMPASPDLANSGNTLLATLTKNADDTSGLVFDTTAPNGVLRMPPADGWGDPSPAANGTATFWRWNMGSDDNSTAGGSQYRLQGTCGPDASYSMFLASTAILTTTPLILAAFQYIEPSA